ncbi:MAG TPA: hypothetical protein DDZ80_28210, partial [Cyanobacteria bacterium UBA8803]|nr:hypothetical protein [Cyanobacteria bacterium UBA8803]
FSNDPSASITGNLDGQSGDLTLEGDEINIGGTIDGTGNLTIQSKTATQAIAIGGADSNSNSTLDFTEINSISNNFTSITIGREDSSGGITVASAVNFNGPVLTLRSPNGSSINVNAAITGNGNTSVTLNGATNLNANIATSNQNITLNGNTTLAAPVTFNTDGGAINFNGTVNGNQNFTLAAGTGSINFNNAVGNNTPVGSGTGAAITINSGNTTFNSTLNTASGLTINSDVTFKDNVTLATGDTPTTLNGNVTLDGLNFQSGGNATFGNDATAQITLSTDNVSITTTANNSNLVFNGAVDGSPNLNLQTNGTGNITFNSAVGSQTPVGDIQANSTGTTRFNSTVQAASLTTNTGGETQLNGNVTTTGTLGQNYGDNLRIDNSITLNSGNGPVNFSSTVNSQTGEANDLTVNANNISFTGDVGNLAPLDILTLNSASNVNTQAINATHLTVTAEGDMNTSDINTSSTTETGGTINLTSKSGVISTGNLNSSSTSGGEIFLNAFSAITTGAINTSGSVGDGGNVTLDPIGDIQVVSINAQGGKSGRGGDVDISAGQFFRATSIFSDRNGTQASISTAGGNGSGDIIIRHGGNGQTSFEVGDGTTNGTAGAITSGDFTIAPTQSFPFTHTEGNIQIISIDPPINLSEPPNNPPEPSINPPEPLNNPPEPSINPIDINKPAQISEPSVQDNSELFEESEPSVQDNSELFEEAPIFIVDNSSTKEAIDNKIRKQEESLTNEFENYLGISDTPTVTLEQAQATLKQIEQATGIKPALIYAVFVPTTAPSPSNGSKSQPKPTSKEPESLWQFNSFGLSSTPVPNPSPDQTARDDDELELVLVTAEGQPIRGRVAGVTRKQVIDLTKKLRQAVTDISIPRPYLPLAKNLYRWLVAPLESQLEAQQINNLVFTTDSSLRSIPLAVLHDGSEFIIQRYSVSLMPSLSLTDTRYVPLKNLKVLAMGASQFTDQNPLPAVPFELSLIAEKLWSGQVFLNQAFTLDNLKQARATVPFGILHLATHGEFKPGKPSNSYIQFWDTKLQLDQLRQLKLNDPPVELLVLSACRTALGDEQAELGFTGLAVQAGVKSALGSLWYVSDEGTLGFMTQFYQQLQEAPIKAEAMRQAQLAMIRGEVRLEGGQLITPSGSIPLPPELAQLEDKQLTHPYYWSAFTLIGNPW